MNVPTSTKFHYCTSYWYLKASITTLGFGFRQWPNLGVRVRFSSLVTPWRTLSRSSIPRTSQSYPTIPTALTRLENLFKKYQLVTRLQTWLWRPWNLSESSCAATNATTDHSTSTLWTDTLRRSTKKSSSTSACAVITKLATPLRWRDTKVKFTRRVSRHNSPVKPVTIILFTKALSKDT